MTDNDWDIVPGKKYHNHAGIYGVVEVIDVWNGSVSFRHNGYGPPETSVRPGPR